VDDLEPTDGADLLAVLGGPSGPAPPRLSPGQVVDDAYRIEAELGAGGMGRVYRATDLRLSRSVAIKLHSHARAPELLQREATALAKLAHPHVVTVYEVGTWAGHPWVAMEYVDGGDLRSWLATPRATDEILTRFREAGRGLQAAHAAGLVHRDFKPENVLVGSDQRARVADFGLASEHGASVDGPSGTPSYMAPEQREGGPITAAADQYAFAVSLWEALTGARPDGGKPARPLPSHVEKALRRALATEPSERWPSLEPLLAELARDPSRVRRGALLVGAAALVAGSVAWFARSPAPTPTRASCDDGTAAMAATWTPAVRAGLEPRAVSALEAWTGQWRTEHRAACEAPQTERMRDLRMACLERARTSLAATLAVITPARALDAVVALPRIEDCADPSLLAGEPDPQRSVVDRTIDLAANALVARARALRQTGQAKEAVIAGTAALAFGEHHRRPRITAEARMELAAATYSAGTLDGVLAMFEQAAQDAAAAHDDVLEARAWGSVVDMLLLRLEKPEEAERLLVVQDAAVARAGKPPALIAMLVLSRADLAMARQDWTAAIAGFEAAIRQYTALYGPDDERVMRAYHRIATAYVALQQAAPAITALAEATTRLERKYGPEHPRLGVTLTTLGTVQAGVGETAAAIASYERALAIKIAASGPDHPSLAPTLFNLALVLADDGQLPAALAAATRGAAIAEGALPPTHPKVGAALALRGRLEAASGALAAARITLDRARAIVGDDEEEVAKGLALLEGR